MARYERTEEQALLDTEALRLRTLGHTYEQIAQRQGCDTSTAYRRTQRCLGDIPREAAEDFRELEGQRLDLLQQALWPRALEGDYRAVKGVLEIMARRAKLYGLDQPTRSTVELADFSANEIEREVQRLARLLEQNPELLED